jgi:branched-chain amino acid aminotransferase
MLPRSLNRASIITRPTTLALTSSSRRPYSINPPPPSNTLQAPDAADPRLSKINTSALTITKTTTPKSTLPHNELVFGRNFTDHMLLLEWTAADGWMDPRITPYQNLSLDPATCVLHYAFEAFEGMKAYKDRKGNVRLFRPDKNMARLNKSAARIALPRFDGEAFIELLKKFVTLDERFIPS